MIEFPLRTERLLLRPATLDLAVADLENRSSFARSLGAEIPDSWPPELYDDDARRWVVRSFEDDPLGPITYYMLLKRSGERLLLVGVGGFKGRPKDGVTEIGYSLVPAWHGKGLGTEAVGALTGFAFQQLDALTVCAHTLPELLLSQRVLEKNGFIRRGTAAERGTIRYEITRAEWQSSKLSRAATGRSG